MHAREKGVGGQEGKKRRQRMVNTSVVVVPHQKPQPRLCLPLVCVWRVWQVWGVCGRRGDQWQPPLWHSGCCGVCDGVEWWWWEWQGVPNKQHAMVCVVVDVACVVAGKASGWRGVAATQCPHAHHQPPPWRPPPVPVCVCGTRGVVVVTTTPKQPGKRHACACAVCVMAHESRWMSTRTPTSVCGGCVGSEATSV